VEEMGHCTPTGFEPRNYDDDDDDDETHLFNSMIYFILCYRIKNLHPAKPDQHFLVTHHRSTKMNTKLTANSENI